MRAAPARALRACVVRRGAYHARLVNPPWIRPAAAAAAPLALAMAIFGCLRMRPPAAAEPGGAPPDPPRPAPAATPFAGLRPPTDHPLDRPEPRAFQPTASGRPESALYGSVRTARRGRSLEASFHEGLDIAPAHRDPAGRPLDPVRAVADGTVAYVNPAAGMSNYGRYAVLLHAAPSGSVYTLYAHLASCAPGLAPGLAVRAGDVIGRLGATGIPAIPRERAHLHFEIGLVLNTRFGAWSRARRLKPWHGAYHGWNLAGVDPLAVYEAHARAPGFDVFEQLAAIPVAFEVLLAARRRPEFFDRYPGLWDGPPGIEGAVRVAVSEGGVPLRGRAATEEERRALAGRSARVVRVDRDTLGRNGRGLVRNRAGRWELGAAGERWREILVY